MSHKRHLTTLSSCLDRIILHYQDRQAGIHSLPKKVNPKRPRERGDGHCLLLFRLGGLCHIPESIVACLLHPTVSSNTTDVPSPPNN